MVNIWKIHNANTRSENGGKQAEDSRKKGREHVARNTVRYLKPLERRLVEEQKERPKFEEEGGDLDPEQLRLGREGDGRQGQDAWDVRVLFRGTSKAGKAPTTTKWIDRVRKDDDVREFVRCRLVARGFQTKTRGSEGRSVSRRCHHSMQRKHFLHTLQGVREQRREQGQDEVLMSST